MIEKFQTKTPVCYVLRIGDMHYANDDNGVTATSNLEQAREFSCLENAIEKLIYLSALNLPVTLVPCFDKSEWIVFNAVCTDQDGINKLKHLANTNPNIYLTESRTYL